jgi:hypothetical protein
VVFNQVDNGALSHDLEAENVFAPTDGQVGCFLGKVVFKCLPVFRFSIKENAACFSHVFVVLCCLAADDLGGVVAHEHIFRRRL